MPSTMLFMLHLKLFENYSAREPSKGQGLRQRVKEGKIDGNYQGLKAPWKYFFNLTYFYHFPHISFWASSARAVSEGTAQTIWCNLIKWTQQQAKKQRDRHSRLERLRTPGSVLHARGAGLWTRLGQFLTAGPACLSVRGKVLPIHIALFTGRRTQRGGIQDAAPNDKS